MSSGLQLVMSQGPSPGRAFTIEHESSTLGRDPTNQIVVNEPQVSRLHARILLREGTLIIEDLGSTNGTFVNGVRLTGSQMLSPGDVIGLGESVTLTFYSSAAISTAAMGAPSVPQAPAPREVPPSPLPAAPPAYAPFDPSPQPEPAPYEAEDDWDEEEALNAKRRQHLYIGCGCLALLLACLAVSLGLWYAPATFWEFLIERGIPIPPNPF